MSLMRQLEASVDWAQTCKAAGRPVEFPTLEVLPKVEALMWDGDIWWSCTDSWSRGKASHHVQYWIPLVHKQFCSCEAFEFTPGSEKYKSKGKPGACKHLREVLPLMRHFDRLRKSAEWFDLQRFRRNTH